MNRLFQIAIVACAGWLFACPLLASIEPAAATSPASDADLLAQFYALTDADQQAVQAELTRQGYFDKVGSDTRFTVGDRQLGIWRAAYLLCEPQLVGFGLGLSDILIADGNGDGFIDVSDYTVWRDNLGREIFLADLLPPQQSVPGAFENPEPAALLAWFGLIGIGAFVAVRRRRSLGAVVG